jgi:hypothetical protein
MCQEAVRKLCNPSESSHVRKVARLLARPLKRYQVGSYHPHRLAFAWWYMGYAATRCLLGVLHLHAFLATFPFSYWFSYLR